MVVYFRRIILYIEEQQPHSFLKKVRKIAILPGEDIALSFSSQQGLVSEPTSDGDLLIVTSERVFSFTDDRGNRAGDVVRVEDIDEIIVTDVKKNYWNLYQAIFMTISGLFIYLCLAYWITGKWNGPTVPIINIDAGPLILLIAILVCFWLISQRYYRQRNASITLKGQAWSITTSTGGSNSESDLYELANVLSEKVSGSRPKASKHSPLI